ncbi:MAG: DUF72 domain-containing protein [Bryobacteraceae bacterium]
MARIFAGTSGFAYGSWKPRFYPEKIPARRFLEYYATRLNAVEINYTFRRLPSESTLRGWMEATPPGFLFALKAPMRITHVLRLHEAGESLARFLKAITPLAEEERLGPVLFQLPPQMPYAEGRLEEFLPLLPAGVRAVFEFRHPSWLREDVYAALRKRNAALCTAEPDAVTADFAYSRLREPPYAPEAVDAIARRARQLAAAGKDVCLFFKHEDSPEGAFHAERVLRYPATAG